ncbi:MAG: response regulator transcription factor [Poseidonibacter sp.]|uniref:response regulator transcription factor n=1 Tax=Poseidonibacter sp. TaxID=2321188 RepID=UPI00359EE2A5
MNKLNLLYVEDDIDVRDNVVFFLKRFFTNIYTAGDGIQAYEIYKKEDIDLLLLDINVPKMNGITFAKKIRAENTKVPIVFLTAYSDKERLLEVIKIGVSSYIIKPFDIKELLSTIQSCINIVSEEKKIINKVLLGENLIWEIDKKNLLFHNENIRLTNNEIMLIELFIKFKNKVFTPDEIIEELFPQSDIQANTITQMISRFKRKIIEKTQNESFFIENIYKKGYKLK